MADIAIVHMSIKFGSRESVENFFRHCSKEMYFDTIKLSKVDIDVNLWNNIGYIISAIIEEDLNENNISIILTKILQDFQDVISISITVEPIKFIGNYEIKKFKYTTNNNEIQINKLNQDNIIQIANENKIQSFKILNKDAELMDLIYEKLK